MAWSFGDGFDLYVQGSIEAGNNYWDSFADGLGCFINPGRFPGSRSIGPATNSAMVKSSGQNDAVHHIVLGYQQGSHPTFGGPAAPGPYFTFGDDAIAQCSIVFHGDGSIALHSGAYNGAVLATYTGAVPLLNVWYAFEFALVISDTVGSFMVRRNGNPVNDFTATGLNTRTSTHNYANRLTFGLTGSGFGTNIDDLFWKSDVSSVPWLGDIRCDTRHPVSDASVQFAHSTGATNFGCVDEAQENGLTDYVFDSTIGHADFYNISPITSIPATTFAVTTRGYAIKSDAGTRVLAMQVKSGAAVVASPTYVLTTSMFEWVWRTDTVDPNTGAAWTPTAVDNLQVGPLVTA